jgi:hypothetical protein
VVFSVILIEEPILEGMRFLKATLLHVYPNFVLVLSGYFDGRVL